MDEAASDNANESGSRPSGRGGSKISSRSSEHSIAKLMETLQATAGGAPTPSPSLQSLKNQALAGNEQPQVSVSMAQSMPASVLANQLQVCFCFINFECRSGLAFGPGDLHPEI